MAYKIILIKVSNITDKSVNFFNNLYHVILSKIVCLNRNTFLYLKKVCKTIQTFTILIIKSTPTFRVNRIVGKGVLHGRVILHPNTENSIWNNLKFVSIFLKNYFPPPRNLIRTQCTKTWNWSRPKIKENPHFNPIMVKYSKIVSQIQIVFFREEKLAYVHNHLYSNIVFFLLLFFFFSNLKQYFALLKSQITTISTPRSRYN